MTVSRRLGTLAVGFVLGACAGAPEPVVELSAAAASASNDVLLRTTYGFEAEVNLAEMTRHPRGFLYRVIEEGTGTESAPGRNVAVSYVVRLADGREVDRAEATRPMRFRIGDQSVIPAFDAAVREMRVGGARQLVVPPRLGYGARGRGPVPPNAILVMIVKLESVQ
jgi:FKBP-type peptidyl-prolyl cis-trans isomerase